MIRNGVLYPTPSQSAEIAAWVAARIPHLERGFQDYQALGVVADGEFVAGVVFHHYRPSDGDIEASMAATSPRWCRPAVLRELFAYPFIDLRCERLTLITSRSNTRTRRLCERAFGMKLEGILRRAIGRREDALVYGLLREECRWIKDTING